VIMIVEFVQIPRSAGYGFAASLVVSGLVLVPLSVCSFLASRFLVVYEQRFGRRTMIPLGSVVVAVAAIFFSFDHSALWEAFLTIAVSGVGIGFTTAAMPGFVVRAVPPSGTGSAMGRYQVMRSIGSSVGSAERRRAAGPHPARSDPAGRGRLHGDPDHRRRPVPDHGGGQLRASRTGAIARQRPHHL
jgi:MFS family permease